MRTEAEVQILKEGEGFAIKKIALSDRRPRARASTRRRSRTIARQAKEICPISKALGAVETIEVDATLEA